MEVEEDSVPLCVKDKKKGFDWREMLERRLPVVRWGRRYTRGWLVADVVAGVTLGLTLVPQSIAYAALADLPPQYGLYSSFVGTIVYVFLGTVKEVSIGPTSLMALLTLQTCARLTVHHVVLLTFLSGCVVFMMGVLRLGFLVELISPSVTNGFTSATAVIIAGAQLKGLVGLRFTAESLADNAALLWRHAGEARAGDALLAAACCALLLALRKLQHVRVSPKRRRVQKALWLVSISRNALVVVASSLLAFATADPAQQEHPYFILSGRVRAGLPSISLPPFGIPAGNGTAAVPAADMVRQLGSGLLLLPTVMVIANIAIAKAFCSGRVDASQEMVTLGVCNMLGSLVQAMPACGAFTRSSVSSASGVRTPLAGLYAGCITLLALAYMTEYFRYIPRASLSAVLVCAVAVMVDVATPRRLWRESRPDFAALAVTFVASCLISVEIAIVLGCCVSLCAPMRRLLRPAMSFRVARGAGAAVCAAGGALTYLSASRVRAALSAAARAAPPGVSLLLLDCGQVAMVDYTCIRTIMEVREKLSSQGWTVAVYNASDATLRQLAGVERVDVLRARSASAAAAVLRAGGGAGGEDDKLLGDHRTLTGQ